MATLFALPVCQSLKNKLHPRKTNTHTANMEKELLGAESISRPGNNGREHSLAGCRKARPALKVSKKERMHPSVQTLTGLEGRLLCTHPSPNPKTSPPSKLIHVKLCLYSALLSYHHPLRGSGNPRLTPSGVPCQVYKNTHPNRHWNPSFTNHCGDESKPVNCIFPGRLHFTTSDAIQNKKATLAGVYNNSLY